MRATSLRRSDLTNTSGNFGWGDDSDFEVYVYGLDASGGSSLMRLWSNTMGALSNCACRATTWRDCAVDRHQ